MTNAYRCENLNTIGKRIYYATLLITILIIIGGVVYYWNSETKFTLKVAAASGFILIMLKIAKALSVYFSAHQVKLLPDIHYDIKVNNELIKRLLRNKKISTFIDDEFVDMYKTNTCIYDKSGRYVPL